MMNAPIQMHVDRLRWLVETKNYLSLAGAVEIARAAPDLLRQIEAKKEEGKT